MSYYKVWYPVAAAVVPEEVVVVVAAMALSKTYASPSGNE
jgi:hypothetical protein